MNRQYSHEEIKLLYADFQSIKRYTEKVHFFDLHFNVVPFEFPPFETNLYKFFSAEGVYKLTEILRIEQKNPALLDRVFHFENVSYTFSIRPANSNGVALNNYILSKFLNKNDRLDLLVMRHRKTLRKHAGSLENMLDESSQMMTYLSKRIDAEYESKASVETKLMAVFMKGYNDSIKNARLSASEKRRKFVELYLYAYGYLYGRYMMLLNDSKEPEKTVELEKKIILLQELGLMDGIRKKYVSLNHEELKVKAAEIVGFITGEYSPKLTDKIVSLIAQR